MKKKNLFRRTYRLGKLWTLSGAFVLAACTKDATAELSANGPALRFDVGLSGSWTPGVSAPSAAPASERSDTLAGTCPEVYALRGPAPADTLFLHASVADGIESDAKTDRPQTRATPVGTETFYDSFGALAYVYTGAWSDALTPDYMYNVEITEASGWTATDYNWPGRGKKIRFFAYAPYGAEGAVLSAQQTAGAPTITYTTPSAVADQKDLLVAAPAEMDGASAPDKTAALTFGHALTAVKFSVGDDMMAGRITKITLKNVYGKAVYNMGAEQWSGFTSSSSFTQTLSKEVDGTPDEEITSEEATFMMIPQTLPSGATIEVGYTDKLTNTARTLTASIAGTTWPVGRTVTYRISTTSISIASTFTITAPDEFTYAGGTNVYKVDSRGVVSRPNDPEKSVPLAWTAEFVEDDGAGGYRVIEQPEWITGFTASGDGGNSAQSYNATVAAQTDSGPSNPHNEILKKAEPVSGTYDLSTKGGTSAMNTANCYVINAPGKYSLPLVYGNAIKNGSTNASAYTSQASSGANVLQKFINHTGNAITDPYIYNNANCTPDNATLVWQDSPELVTNVALSSDKHSITFDVNQASIAQGNAVVAVRNASGQIMWSWHIWVTDYVPGLEPTVEMTYDPSKTQRDKVVTNCQNVKYTFMGVPAIGWCYGKITSYEGRSVKVRFTQAETGATQVIEITQTPYSVSTAGNAPYYQFGRKDPMLPSTGSSDNNKTWYDAEGTSSTALATANWPMDDTTITNGILNPGVFCTNNYMDFEYYNLWSANNTKTKPNDDPIVKTIYDPSPVGYHLPPGNAFTGFTYNGDNISGSYYGSQYNSPYTSEVDFTTNGGWIFYCNKMNGEGSYDTAGGTIFFPASGYRQSSSDELLDVVGGGYYSSALPEEVVSNIRYLCFISIAVAPLGSYFRASGFVVRPVQE
ncbi:fimbrillin family protein [Alistipes communis]|uniref:fimbrillin family protein n=1 Tax=Alistipes communis TaxID=2585118 RepID=UPI003AF781BF